MLIAAVTLLAAQSLHVETLTYKFDKVHTQIHASVNHMGFSNSTARFRVKDGGVSLDPADLSKAKVAVVIDANSMDLGDPTWKEHLSDAK